MLTLGVEEGPRLEHSFLFLTTPLKDGRDDWDICEKILNISTAIQSEMVLIIICCLTVKWTFKHESADS